MFRRFYLQISAAMTATSIALLALLGVFVYHELSAELQQSGEARLVSEMAEVENAISETPRQNTGRFQFADETGQNVFVDVFLGNTLKASSSPQPVPSHDVLAQLQNRGDRFATFRYEQKPYRMYVESWNHMGQTLLVVIYSQISDESETLRRVMQLLLGGGGVGALLLLFVNLWFANRALRPARNTWDAHRNMMIELSHELQTPLATLKALVHTNVHDPEIRHSLNREVTEASDMVQDILYLSRLQSEPRVAGEPTAVSDITDEVAVRIAFLADQRRIALVGTAEPGIYVMTTTEKWSRLVSTLLKNVVDHAAEGSTATWQLRAADGRAVLTVVNERPAETTRSSQHGFGMSIAQRLVREMNGTLTADWQGIRVQMTVSVPRLVR